jgi:hypothetical protein
MLDSGFFENQMWSALHKAWKEYVIAKNKDDMKKWSQYDLGLEVSSFDNIGMPASSFLWQIAQEDDNNQEKEATGEEYLTDRQYEEERFTDDMPIVENFTD